MGIIKKLIQPIGWLLDLFWLIVFGMGLTIGIIIAPFCYGIKVSYKIAEIRLKSLTDHDSAYKP